MTIHFTKIVSDHGPLTKRIFLDENGQMQKQAAAQLYRGQYQVVGVPGLQEFAEQLELATADTAFTYGVPDTPSGMIVREDDLSQYSSAIARTRNYFTWPKGPGILMIDDDSGLSTSNFAEFLWEVVGVLDGVDILVRPSSSSLIFNSETDEWVHVGSNRRAYVIVSDARAIPAIGKLVEDYLWLANYGYYEVSKSGRLLKRCPADTCVWQPERLDFVGGAVCVPPLAQKELKAELYEGGLTMVDASRLPELSDRDKAIIEENMREARQFVEKQRIQVRQDYLDARTTELVHRGVSSDVAHATIQTAIEGQVLGPNFVLTMQDGALLTVGELLAAPAHYHGMRCHDPLEPDYRNDPRVAYISLKNGTQPYIYSHAHGGCCYQLKKAAKTIQIVTGESAKGTDEIAQHLSGEGLLYERGQLLVTLQSDGQTRAVNPATAKYLAGTHCNLQRFDNRKKDYRSTDLPDSIAQLMITRTGHGVYKPLTAVITAPTITPQGRLIAVPGYDVATGLLLIQQQESAFFPIPQNPKIEDLRNAFDLLWYPFKDFPFDGDNSKSCMVAALLTAVVRPCLATAPGFGFDAPTAASGKTKLALCIAALATGNDEALLPPPTDDEETRKKIATALANTKQVMIFDNVEAQLKSPAMAAFLTARTWSDRLLGGNTEIHASNRVLTLITGNNLMPQGDIVRRMLIVRIDPQLEATQVWQREFELDPLDYVIRNRQRLVAAALTLLSGFVAAGMPRLLKGRLASFEEWDDQVRQCIIWLGQQGVGNLIDPVERLNSVAANDPENLRLAALVADWFNAYGDAPQLLKDVIRDPVLYDSLKEVAQDRGGQINTKMLAAYLAKRIGKITNGYRLERINGRSNTALWRVVQLPGVASSAGGSGGFDGAISPHAPDIAICLSLSDIFSREEEINPPNPPIPPLETCTQAATVISELPVVPADPGMLNSGN